MTVVCIRLLKLWKLKYNAWNEQYKIVSTHTTGGHYTYENWLIVRSVAKFPSSCIGVTYKPIWLTVNCLDNC